jgi:hypothetical protein
MQNKPVALVTGANQGIGLQISRKLALYYLSHSGMSLSWPLTRLLTAAACTVH